MSDPEDLPEDEPDEIVSEAEDALMRDWGLKI